MSANRLKPDWPLPPYAFLPGQNPHPFKAGGHGIGKDVEEKHLTRQEVDPLWESPYFLYSVDLYNHAYYWEAHVYWEALWNAWGRKSPEAQALQGLIMLAAAGVKLKQGQEAPAEGHLQRAQELFSRVTTEAWKGPELAELIRAAQLRGLDFLNYKLKTQV